jgi:hypothetical protein
MRAFIHYFAAHAQAPRPRSIEIAEERTGAFGAGQFISRRS